MKTLLKDLPEHKERIENNYSLSESIKDILEDRSEWSESKQQNVILQEDMQLVYQDIISKVTEFVNDNYEWKGLSK